MIGSKDQGGLLRSEPSLEKAPRWCEVGQHKEREKHSCFVMEHVLKVHTLVVGSLKYISHKNIASHSD